MTLLVAVISPGNPEEQARAREVVEAALTAAGFTTHKHPDRPNLRVVRDNDPEPEVVEEPTYRVARCPCGNTM